MPINIALLNYGFSNFCLEILEFCELEKLMEREKYYFDILSPEYNILKIPGSPYRGKGWKHSEATLDKMKLAAMNKSPEKLAQLSLAQSTGKKVEVINMITGIKTTYHAIRAAAKKLGIDKRYIENYIYLKQKNPVFDTYIFKLIEQDSNSNTRIQNSSKTIEVTDITNNNKTTYPSISSAAKNLGIRQPSISLYLKDKRSKPFRGKYLFKII